jgi:hypothetical protein
MKTQVDDKSFEEFLNSLTWDDLMEHASNHFSDEYAIQVLLEQEYNYADYLLNLKNIETDEEPDKLKDQVLVALNEVDEDTIISLLINFTPEDTIISKIIETTDEDGRMDIISNQTRWDSENDK